MATAEELFARLRRVRLLRFTTRRVDTSDISGSGAGTVVVAAPSADSLTFTESGDWQNSAGCTFRFHNIYRWSQIGPTSVRLEHQRRGAASAVHLLDLTVKSGSANRWISAKPHLCGNDTYAAQFEATSGGGVLQWTIRGPRKSEHIITEYFPPFSPTEPILHLISSDP